MKAIYDLVLKKGSVAPLVLAITILSGTPRAAAQASPQLAITNNGSQITVSWPASNNAFALQWATNTPPSNSWQTFPSLPATNDGNLVMSVAAANAYEFFRLAPLLPPTAITEPGTVTNFDSIVLNGKVNPGNDATTVAYFNWGTSTNYGEFTAQINTGVTQPELSLTVASLSAATTYHYQIVAINTQGTNFGADNSFTTSNGPTASPPPTVQTLPPTNFPAPSSFDAVINASQSGSVTYYVYYEYGLTGNYGSVTMPPGAATSNAREVYVGQGTSGLLVPSTTYHYRVVVFNGTGTVLGNDVVFVSPTSQ